MNHITNQMSGRRLNSENSSKSKYLKKKKSTHKKYIHYINAIGEVGFLNHTRNISNAIHVYGCKICFKSSSFKTWLGMENK